MVEAGDIVFLERRGEHWAVLELVRSTPNGLPDALISNGRTQLRVSAASLTTVISPTFAPGDKVRLPFGNDSGTVVRDLGDVIEVTHDRPAPPLGAHARSNYVTPINRGRLSAANLHSLVLGD